MASIASMGPRSASSIASATSLARKPTLRADTAAMPASGPGPKIATKSRPQITVFTEREATRMPRPTAQVKPLAVVLRAARNAIGTEKTTAIAVPSVAMWIVSMSGATIVGRDDQRGGHMRSARSAACTCASLKKTHSISSAETDHTEARATATIQAQWIAVSRGVCLRHAVGCAFAAVALTAASREPSR